MKTLACAALALSILSCAAAQTINPALWSGLKYRTIGPERGGRVTTVTGVPSQPNTYYMGSTGGDGAGFRLPWQDCVNLNLDYA